MKIIILLVMSLSVPAQAKLYVVTTTSDIKALTEEVGKSFVNVDSISLGSQDPHRIEPKPSFMLKMSRADLLISNGMELEIGWLPSLIAGGRNPKINSGQPGNFELGSFVESPLEIPQKTATRADGDVHPDGNPHYMLDPVRVAILGLKIALKLGELDPEHALGFLKNAEDFKKKIDLKVREWSARIERTNIKQVITYHKTMSYFLDRFKIQSAGILEIKPGIPPTIGHLLEIQKLIETKKIPLVLIENYFDEHAADKIKESIKSLRVQSVPVSVGGVKNTDSLETLWEYLVKSIEEAGLK